MVELIKSVAKTVEEEQFRAEKQYGKYNASSHESYAVIKEELDEASDELASLNEDFSKFWTSVKGNSKIEQIGALIDAETHAVHAAAELIQVAAMCRKAKNTTMEAIK